MRFLKTFFRFFTIVTLCTTFTTVAWGTDCQTNIIQADTCNKHEGCYNNEGWGKSKCHECPVGNKCPYSTLDSKDPTPCNNGTYQDLTGQAGCKTCSAGTMTPNDGNAYTSCTKCSAGTYSAAGASSCSNCAPGSYSGAAGASSCTKCPVGFYQSAGGQKDCDKCPDGTTTSGEGKTGPNDCKKKFNLALYVEYKQGGNTGIYSVSTSTIAYYEGTTAVHSITTMKHQLASKISDLKNKYTAPTETNQAYISINGTKYSLTSNGDNWQSTSTLTNALASQAHDSTFNLVFILQPKPYNVYMLSASTNSGVFSANDPERNIAVKTTETVTKHFGDTPSDGVSPNTNNVSKCNNAFYGYIADTTTPEYYECTISGSDATIQLSTKQTTMFEPSEGGKHICVGYTHTACEAGYSCNSCVRTACATGTYQDATGQSSCKDCVAGKKTGVNGTGATSCTACDKGTYSSGTANALCTSCDVGTYQDTTGATSCKPCSTGTYQDTTGQYSCKSCSTQTSSKYPSSASGSDSISDCYLTLTDGKYVPTAGGGVQSCPAGSYCSKSGTTVYQGSPNSPTTAAVSGQCVKGEYSTGGASMCSPCQEGYATGINGTGATSCTACPAGTYSDDAVNYECDPCPAGSHQNEAGQSTCDTCSAGTYSAAGMSDCVKCPIGTYQNNDGQSSCISCQDGQTPAIEQPSGLFITEKTGTETRNECYLNPVLKLKDSIDTSKVTLQELSGTNVKIFYVGSGS